MRKQNWLIAALLLALGNVANPFLSAAGQTASAALFVNVTDEAGQLVTGLESKHFAVFENDEPREITSFSVEETPASRGIALHLAGNLPNRLAGMHEALKLLVERGKSENEVFLVGNVPLAESIARAHAKLAQSRHAMRALLVLTDGTDVSDDALRQARVPLYFIGLNEAQSFSAERQAALSELAQATGGTAIFPASTGALETALARIGSELRHQDRLSYVALPGDQARHLKATLHPPRGLPALTARVSRSARQ